MNEFQYGEEQNFETCYGLYHVIERGDSLYKLSKKYRVSVSDLMNANPYADVYNLQVGEMLCIPSGNAPVLEVENTKNHPHFSEEDTVKEVLQKAGISMSEFVQWLNQKN